MIWSDHIPHDINNLYEVYDFKHAAAILVTEFREEFHEVCVVLRTFRFMEEDIIMGGGNESNISKKFSNILRPMGWKQERLNGKILINDTIIRHDTPKLDYIKGRISFDIEWNGKDQTFDRYLHAIRTFFDYDRISLGILLTISNDLDRYLNKQAYNTNKRTKDKYRADITNINKLIHRIETGGNGDCPLLIFEITPKLLYIAT